MRCAITITVLLNGSFVRSKAQKTGRTEDEIEQELVRELDSKARDAVRWHDGVLMVVDSDVVGGAA